MSDAIRAARKRLIDSELYDVKVYEEGGGLIGQGHSRTADLITVADIWPDDLEKYTPEWAHAEFGPSRLYLCGDGDMLPVCIDFDPHDDLLWITNADAHSVVIPAPQTKGAARRLVAAIRECCEKKETEK